MKKGFSRFLAGLLAFVMILSNCSVLQITAWAEEEVSVEVKVVSFDDSAVSGASVTVNGTTETTDVNGKAVFTGLTKNETYEATVSCTEYVEQKGQFTANDAAVSDGVVVRLPHSVDVTFEVKSGEVPVNNASVTGEGFSGTTGTDGKATISALTQGQSYTVYVSCEGYAPREVSFAAGVGAIIPVSLTAYTVIEDISGTVLCGADKVGGATVTLVYPTGNQSVTTEGNGAFAITGRFYKELIESMTVSKEGYDSETVAGSAIEDGMNVVLSKSQFVISANAAGAEGGTVTVDPNSVEYGGEATVTINGVMDANGDPVTTIYTILDNGVQKATEAAGEYEYEYKLQNVTEAHNIVVTFANEVETIDVWFDANGNLYTRSEKPDTDPVEYVFTPVAAPAGLQVVMDTDPETFARFVKEVKYTPAANYRVSKFESIFFGADDTYTDNDHKVEQELDETQLGKLAGEREAGATEKHQLKLEVRLNHYGLNLPDEIKENITSSDEPVMISHNRSKALPVTLPEGKYLADITVDGTSVLGGVDYSEKKPVYILREVKAEHTVEVTFADIVTVSKTPLVVCSEGKGIEGMAPVKDTQNYYLKNVKGAQVTIAVEGAQVSRNASGPFADDITVDSTETITGVYILEGNVVSKVETNIRVTKDTAAPTINVEKTDKVVGKKTVGATFTCTASDEEPCSGIDRVVYSTNAVLNGDERSVNPNSNGKYVLTIGNNVRDTYYFWAIDKAGNVSEITNETVKTVDTDDTAPVVTSLTVSGETLQCFADGNFAGGKVSFTVTAHDEHSKAATATLLIGDKEYTMVRTRVQDDGNEDQDGGNDAVFSVTIDPSVKSNDPSGESNIDAAGDVRVAVADDSANVNESELFNLTDTKENDQQKYASNFFQFDLTAPTIEEIRLTTGAGNEPVNGNWFAHIHKEEADPHDVKLVLTVSNEKSGLNREEIKVKNGEAELPITVVTNLDNEIKEETTEGGTTQEGNKRVTEATVTVLLDGEVGKLTFFDLEVRAKSATGMPATFTSNTTDGADLKFQVDDVAPVIRKMDFSGKVQEQVVEHKDQTVPEEDWIYGYFFSEDATVKVWVDDSVGEESDAVAGSGVKSISFYKVPVNAEREEGKLKEDPEVVTEDAVFDTGSNRWYATFDVKKDFKGMVYAFAEDNTGNNPGNDAEADFHPNGTAIESQNRHNESGGIEDEDNNTTGNHIVYTMPEPIRVVKTMIDGEMREVSLFTTKDSKDDKGVCIDVQVADYFNGIKDLSYTVAVPGGDTVSAVVVAEGADKKVENWGTSVVSERGMITYIDGKIYVADNSNDIKITLAMLDNSGNRSVKTFYISIDNTDPVIAEAHLTPVAGEKDNAPANGAALNSIGSSPYFIGFRAGGTKLADSYPIYAGSNLQLKITERNFDVDGFVRKVEKLLAGDNMETVKRVDLTEKLKIYGPFEDDENGARRDAMPPYTDKTYYLVDLKGCTEEAAGGTYEGHIQVTDMAKHSAESNVFFVIDEIAPTVSISFDNNSARNGNYYKADRTATITVVERNFNNLSGAINGNASLDGNAFNFPALGAWADSGDYTVHTATVPFNADGLYQNFSATYTDLSGKTGTTAVGDFHVDKTFPAIAITGVEDRSANKDVVAPVVTYTDINLDVKTLAISLTGVNSGPITNYQYTVNEVNHGQRRSYADFEHVKLVDDVYTLHVEIEDMAGNKQTQTIRFSCNRFGSVFDLSAIQDMLNKFNQNERNIVVTETNVDAVDPESLRITLTKNGVPVDLARGKDFNVRMLGGEGTWKQYVYTIPSKLFEEDASYSLYFYNVDAAGNVNENIDETKDAQIAFGIDKTKPIVNAIDLASNVQYALEAKTVAVEIKDNLKLENVEIYLNGEKVDYTTDGENFIFEIGKSNSKQSVQIVASDAAGNVEVVDINDFLVTTNLLVRWYNNTPLFIGSLIILFTLGGLSIWMFLAWKRRKKEEQ